MIFGQGAGDFQKALCGGGESGMAAVGQRSLRWMRRSLTGTATNSCRANSSWTHMRGTKATPIPMPTNFLMVSTVGSSAAIWSGV